VTAYAEDFVSKSGKFFTARLRLDNGKIVFEFPPRVREK